MWRSEIANKPWGHDNVYSHPVRKWGYDEFYGDPNNAPPGIPHVYAVETLGWSQISSEDVDYYIENDLLGAYDGE